MNRKLSRWRYKRESICRIAFVVLLFSAAFLLTACGSAKKVPDKTLDGVVEDYVKDHFGHLGLSPSYSYTVSHSPDTPTGTDAVHLVLSLKDPHFIGSATFDATFVYDRYKKLWSALRGAAWTPVSVERYTHVSISKDSVDQAFRRNGFPMEADNYVVFHTEDFAADLLPEGGKVTSAWDYVGDELILLSVTTDNIETARGLVNAVRDLADLEDYYPSAVDIVTKAGANYELSMVDGYVEGAYGKGYMGYIDNNVFLMIAAKDYDDIREPFDRAMAEIGVFFE